MAKITRKTAQQFATAGAGTDVEQFASFQVNGVPTYTTNPATIMAPIAGVSYWKTGWTAAQAQGTFAPYFQDRNAVDLVTFYQLAYLLQEGIAEWDSATTYFMNSVAQSGGQLFLSLQDNNANNVPPVGTSNSFWRIIAFPSTNPARPTTRTVYTVGSGTYTPPVGCVRIFVRLVGGGGGGAGTSAGNSGTNGGDTTFGTFTAGGGHTTTGSGLTPGIGGTAAGGDVNIVGTPGGLLSQNHGGKSKFGGSGGSALNNTGNTPGVAGTNAAANSGSGGSGAGRFSAGVGQLASGGGSGGYVEGTVYAPTATSYAVGAGGVGGPGGNLGGNGAAGIVVIDEYYY